LKRGADQAQVTRRLGDIVIGGQYSHQRVAALAHQVCCGQANGRGCVAALGLCQNLPPPKVRQLPAHGRGLLVAGDYPNARSGEQRRQALGGLLQHSLLPDNAEQLLGCARAAARPEARAAAAG